MNIRRNFAVATLGALFCTSALPAMAAPLSMSTLSDDIRLDSLPEGGTLNTVSGDVRVQSVGGALSANLASGDFQAGKVVGGLNVHSASGNITVDTVTGPVDIRSASGDVDLHKVEGTVNIELASGNVDLPSVTSNMHVRTASGDVKAALVGSGGTSRSVDIRTASGNVVLHLPHDFDGRLDLGLTETASTVGKYHITQDFGLKVETGEWETHGLGEKTRRLYVVGTIGSGRDVVKVHVARSNITVTHD